MSEKLLNDEYAAAAALYSSEPPAIVGRLVLGSSDTELLPIDLETVYGAALQTIAGQPKRARDWAATYGMLNVGVALDASATRFALDDVAAYRPALVAELQTSQRRGLAGSFCAAERDAPLAFVLAESEQVIELQLIKALHMLDFAIMRGQLDVAKAADTGLLVLRADTEELVRLRRDNRGVALRMYGNVRGRADASRLLGAVAPTQLIEASGAKVQVFDKGPPRPMPAAVQDRERIDLSRQPAVAFGVTTAKRLHIGHVFLLAKALSTAGRNGTVVAELNDLGPRVALAVGAYATKEQISFADAAARITAGTVGIEAIEAAYRVRDGVSGGQVLPEGFSLTAGNICATEQLQSLAGGQLVAVTNSASVVDLMPELRKNRAARELFGGSGMTLVSTAAGESVVVEAAGRPTLTGIIAALSTRYALTFADSPRPIDQRTQSVLAEAGLGVNLVTGMGLSIDFGVASGTKGNAPTVETLLAEAARRGCPPSTVLAACRLMLQEAYFVPGDGGSLNPNYASGEAVMRAFGAALDKVDGTSKEQLYEPMTFRPVEKLLAADAFDTLMGGISIGNRPTVGAVLRLRELFPSLPISAQMAAYAQANSGSPDTVLPKNLAAGSDRYWNKLKTRNPDLLYSLLADYAAGEPTKAAAALAGTRLASAMTIMGYAPVDIAEFLVTIKGVQHVYQLTQ